VVLPFLMLDAKSYEGTPVIIFSEAGYEYGYELGTGVMREFKPERGIYAHHGVMGILFGIILPLVLFAVAAFIALKDPQAIRDAIRLRV
jgi:hypothetical protein